jgi:YD repeat-containing protein
MSTSPYGFDKLFSRITELQKYQKHGIAIFSIRGNQKNLWKFFLSIGNNCAIAVNLRCEKNNRRIQGNEMVFYRVFGIALFIGASLLGAMPFANSAPADCMGTSPDGTAYCTAPKVSSLKHGYCSTTGYASVQNMEGRCIEKIVGAGNTIETEGQLSAVLGCIIALGADNSSPVTIGWRPTGSSEYSYNCGQFDVTEAYGLEMRGYAVIPGYAYGGLYARRWREEECARGFTRVSDASGKTAYCKRVPAQTCVKTCDVPSKVGNPLGIVDGEKNVFETDYVGSGTFPLMFKRSYSHLGYHRPVAARSAVISGFGDAWRHSYDRRVYAENQPYLMASVLRPEGIAKHFRADGQEILSKDGFGDSLVKQTDASESLTGWVYRTSADEVETYNAAGRLVKIVARNGQIQTLTYSDAQTPVEIAPEAGLLIKVADHFGRSLNFTYDDKKRLKTMTDPSEAVYTYAFDANENLLKVTYPDQKFRSYTYASGHLITGIVDENNVQFASYSYSDAYWGYPDVTQLAGGVGKYTRNVSNSSITDPLGTTRNYSSAVIGGVQRITAESQPAGSGSVAGSRSFTYDASGNVASLTNFKGSKTCYAYDLSRSLETARVDGLAAGADCAAALASSSLTIPARKVSTEWHPTYRLPVKVAEPLRMTINSYDPNGNLLSKTVQATSDATGGQGLSAAPVGTARAWSYTYNDAGQVLTARGPRTDIDDTATYVYDNATGNLLSITNALGHITTLSHYDANGRIRRIVDANGMATDLTYSPRGWLTSRTVTSASGGVDTTGYEYDGVGQLKKVSLPDGSWIGYDYDPAHRLTAMYDSLGNRIVYTLDAMGNRLKEEVKDPTGALVRQTTRIYDALNRLKTITGGTQ